MANQTISFTVFKVGERLDKLAHERLPDLSRSQVQSLIKKGLITVDGAQVKAGIKLRGGEEVVIQLPERTPDIIEPENIPLDIVFEDDSIAVINKTANMVVVAMGEEQVDPFARNVMKRVSQRTDAGAGIEHHHVAAAADFQARRVSADFRIA